MYAGLHLGKGGGGGAFAPSPPWDLKKKHWSKLKLSHFPRLSFQNYPPLSGWNPGWYGYTCTCTCTCMRMFNFYIYTTPHISMFCYCICFTSQPPLTQKVGRRLIKCVEGPCFTGIKKQEPQILITAATVTSCANQHLPIYSCTQASLLHAHTSKSITFTSIQTSSAPSTFMLPDRLGYNMIIT